MTPSTKMDGRREATEADMSKTFTLALTGQSLIKHDIQGIQNSGYDAAKAVLKAADLAFTNFESTIRGRHGGWPLKGSFFGCSEPAVLDALQAAGIGAMSLSNNHAFDLGPSGVLSTLEEVEKRGFLHAGLGLNLTEASRAAVGHVNDRPVALVAMDGGPGPDFMYAADGAPGRPERPGVNRLRLTQLIDIDDAMFNEMRRLRDAVGYSAIDLANDSQPDDAPAICETSEIAIARAVFKRAEGFGRSVKVSPPDLARNLAAIREAEQAGCLVIAYLHHHHWAADWYEVPSFVSGVARQCIDAGAAVFASHGAPVLQPIEIYRGRPIFYSLGNFIFHVRSEKSTWTAPEVWESVIATCTFGADNRMTELSLHPVVIGGEDGLAQSALEKRLVPELATGKTASRILTRLASRSAALGTDIRIDDSVGFIRSVTNLPVERPAGESKAGHGVAESRG
jgi:poly-gamma-glutamate synthesis protein (capsule biosynthesis protein)